MDNMNESEIGIMISEEDYKKMNVELEKLKKTCNSLKKQRDSLFKQNNLKDISLMQTKQQLKERNSSIDYLVTQILNLTCKFTAALTEQQKLQKLNRNLENQIKTLKQADHIQFEAINIKNKQLQELFSKATQQNKLLIQKNQIYQKVPKLASGSSQQNQNNLKKMEEDQHLKLKVQKLQKQLKKCKKQIKSLCQTNQGLLKFSEQQTKQNEELTKQNKVLKNHKFQTEK